MAIKIGECSRIYEALMECWRLPLSLMEGTKGMREHASEFLPRWPRETQAGWQVRVKCSTLYNAFKRTVRVLSSKPFGKKPVQIVTAPSELAKLETDTDRAGQTLTQFSRIELTDMLTFGLCYWIVDMPQYDSATMTRAQAAELNIHPYFCRIRPDSLIYWRYIKGITGDMVLDEIHIKSEEIDDDNVEWTWITVWTRESFQTYKKKKTNLAEGEKPEYVKVDDLPNMLGEVPLIIVYADVSKKGEMQAASPLDDLAWMNLKHFQSQSDQDSCLHFARVPFLHFAGFDKQDIVDTVGVDNAFVSKNPQAKISWVEPTGSALEQGSKDLEQLENRMDVMGADLMVQKPGNPTATAKSIDTAEKVSDLQAMVMSLESGLEEAYAMAAKWLNLKVSEDSIDIQLDMSFGLTLNERSELDFLLKARLAGEISRDLFYTEIRRRGIFEEFDIEKELDKVALEEESDLKKQSQLPAPAEA